MMTFKKKTFLATSALLAGSLIAPTVLAEESSNQASPGLTQVSTPETEINKGPVNNTGSTETVTTDQTSMVSPNPNLETGADNQPQLNPQEETEQSLGTDQNQEAGPASTDPLAPTVTEKVLETASTEYVIDETLDYGEREIITEKQDSIETTTTTYKTVNNPRYDLPLDETYRYSPGTVYTIDESKELPSDRIVIDESKLFYPLPEDLDAYAALVAQIQANPSIREAAKGGLFTKTINGRTYYFPTEYWDGSGNSITGEEHTIIENMTHLQGTFLPTRDMIQSASSTYLTKFIPVDNSTTADDFKRYYNSHIITESQYADAKANFLRFQAIAPQVEKELIERGKQLLGDDVSPEKMEHYLEYFNNAKKEANEAFDAITQRYNNTLNYRGFSTDYSTTSLEEEKRQWLEEQLNKIPPQIRQNIPNLFVTDNDLIPHRPNTTGLADLSTTINIKNTKSTDESPRTPKKLLRTLLHEIGHTIDINSGLPSYVDESVGSFSTNDNFTNIYTTYYKDRIVRPHYRDIQQEAFANGFGEFLAWKLFGYKPVRYIAQDEVIYDVEEDHQRYKEGYSPIDNQAVIDYFDKLYQKLLDKPATKSEKVVVVDQVTITHTPRKDGKIALGTKPKVEEELIAFATKEVDSPDLLVGETKVIQDGKNGLKRTTTSYSLVNKETGQLVSNTISEIVREAIDQIIAVGTKTVSVPKFEFATGTPETISIPKFEFATGTPETVSIPKFEFATGTPETVSIPKFEFATGTPETVSIPKFEFATGTPETVSIPKFEFATGTPETVVIPTVEFTTGTPETVSIPKFEFATGTPETVSIPKFEFATGTPETVSIPKFEFATGTPETIAIPKFEFATGTPESVKYPTFDLSTLLPTNKGTQTPGTTELKPDMTPPVIKDNTKPETSPTNPVIDSTPPTKEETKPILVPTDTVKTDQSRSELADQTESIPAGKDIIIESSKVPNKHLVQTNPQDYVKLVHKINQATMVATSPLNEIKPSSKPALSERRLPNTGSKGNHLLALVGLGLLSLMRLNKRKKI
ncbi:G5 domain-containing protein [Streptococcus cuniculipharyngis]|uniref:LPXTG cell wall anchor domain-containing protein n=1 Tax=Streptococcus cuniculipharyngis TaxID=1562651 RepID=A0A5C5SBR4_9STRE|nr:G5 domain-containing protein [Streptococcus cuniculipharyngis]TWS98206.1 LPXTG cell wall anchor domain-containing protein [Streptococcus cuniculipharyngis]